MTRSKLMVTIMAASIAATAAQAEGGDRRPASFDELDANGDGFLTPAEMRAHGEERFAQADADGNGSLSREELIAQVERIARKRIESKVDRMLEKLDANGDGVLVPAEIASRGGRIDPMAHGMRIFARADINEDGKLSRAEFNHLRLHMESRRHRRDRRDDG